MVYMLQIDFLVDMKHYCGLQSQIIIYLIWTMLEFLQNILEKDIIKGRKRGSCLVTKRKKSRRCLGIYAGRMGYIYLGHSKC